MKVLITGATSGIGKALALRFAQAGYDSLLVARNETELRAVAQGIERDFGVTAAVLAVDLTCQDGLSKLEAAILGGDHRIDVLVNNAGFGYFGPTGRSGRDIEAKLTFIQVTVPSCLIHACLQGMVARRSGRILNVASLYSFAPVPFQATYSACKAYLYNYSAALAEELNGTGVTVSVLAPGATRTAFRAPAFLTPGTAERGMNPDLVAKIGYDGLLRGRHLIVPGFWNKLFVVGLARLPRALIAPLMLKINELRNLGQTYSKQKNR